MTARARLVSAYLLLVASPLFLRKGHPMVSYSVENWSASVVPLLRCCILDQGI